MDEEKPREGSDVIWMRPKKEGNLWIHIRRDETSRKKMGTIALFRLFPFFCRLWQ